MKGMFCPQECSSTIKLTRKQKKSIFMKYKWWSCYLHSGEGCSVESCCRLPGWYNQSLCFPFALWVFDFFKHKIFFLIEDFIFNVNWVLAHSIIIVPSHPESLIYSWIGYSFYFIKNKYYILSKKVLKRWWNKL